MIVRHVIRYVFDSALFFGIVGAASNAIIAGFSVLIWRVYRNQLATMRDALIETRESNAATQESNKIAERALLVGNRAWIVPRIDDRTPADARGVDVNLENSGRSPGVIVREGHYIDLFEDDLPEAVTIPPRNYADSAAILPPTSQGYSVTLIVPTLTTEGFLKIQAGNKRMLLCYHIFYRDLAEQVWETKIVWWRSKNGTWLIANKLCEMK